MKKHVFKNQISAAASVCALLSAPYLGAMEIVNPEPTPDDSFGWSLGLSGGNIVVGAYSNQDGGAVYIFDAASGDVKFKLSASDPQTDDSFGFWAGVDGNNIIVSATEKTVDGKSQAGAVYLFDASTGQQTHKLTASDAASGDFFGWTSAISGNTALVGAMMKNIDGKENAGAAYLFDVATGQQTFKLTASDAQAGDSFGSSTAVSANNALVGAYGKSGGGAAYLFDAATGQQTFKLTANDIADGDNFGWSGAIDANTAIVGADGKDASSGAAYLFDVSSGLQTQKLTAKDAAAGDQFGYAVDVSGDVAIVGASMKTVDGKSGAGAVYLFDVPSGEQTVKITASNGSDIDRFGSCVSIEGDAFAVALYGSYGSNTVYTGSVSSLTTHDAGNKREIISGISFESQTDWIVGANTSGNTLLLSAGDKATIMETGKAVYIGKNGASNYNRLEISGTLAANELYIGSIDGNRGNRLQFNQGADYSGLESIFLTEGNALAFEWAWTDELELFGFLGDTDLFVYDSKTAAWIAIDQNNYEEWLVISDTENSGMLVMMNTVPEPASCALLVSLAVLAFSYCRKRK